MQGIDGILMAELALDSGDVFGLTHDVPPRGMAAALGVLPFTFAQRQTSFQTVLITPGLRRPLLFALLAAGRRGQQHLQPLVRIKETGLSRHHHLPNAPVRKESITSPQTSVF
jgi:hypothetical protein